MGSMLSTSLFNVYMNDLIVSLLKLPVSVSCSDTVFNHLLYSDDIVSLALSFKRL